MNKPINLNSIIEPTQQPAIFPNDLESKFEQYFSENTIPFRDLPIDDYKIVSERTFKTKDKRDCMVLTLVSREAKTFSVYAPDRLRNELFVNPNKFEYLRNLGSKLSNSTGNQYFDFRLA